jgi:hypothetical protein
MIRSFENVFEFFNQTNVNTEILEQFYVKQKCAVFPSFRLELQRVIKRHSSKMSTNLTIPQHSCQLYVSMGSLSSSGISITKLFSKVNFQVQQGYFQNHYVKDDLRTKLQG